MNVKRVAICDRCFRREDFGIWVDNSGLPSDWGRVTVEVFDRNGHKLNPRNQDWCPSCAGKLHNLFLLGYTVVREEKDTKAT